MQRASCCQCISGLVDCSLCSLWYSQKQSASKRVHPSSPFHPRDPAQGPIRSDHMRTCPRMTPSNHYGQPSICLSSPSNPACHWHWMKYHWRRALTLKFRRHGRLWATRHDRKKTAESTEPEKLQQPNDKCGNE